MDQVSPLGRARQIHNDLSTGKIGQHGVITYQDFDPPNIEGFKPAFARDFGLPEGREDLVRTTLPLLERLGLHVQKKLLRPSSTGGQGQPYAAMYEITIELH